MTVHPLRRIHRNFTAVFIVLISLTLTHCTAETKAPPFVQPPLPYAENGLEPYMSAQTLALHYGKHHAAYVANANRLVHGTPFEGKSAEEIIRLTAGNDRYSPLFNQAAQASNHRFFWTCLKPSGGGMPSGRLLYDLKITYGSFEKFKIAFIEAANGLFGSGWVWLVKDDGNLSIITTSNADTPLAHGLTPLFGVDVWEHAYYLDYQNRRTDYVTAVLEHLADWNFVEGLY